MPVTNGLLAVAAGAHVETVAGVSAECLEPGATE